MNDHDKLNFGAMTQKEPVHPNVDQEDRRNRPGDKIKRVGREFLIVVFSLILLIPGIPVVLYSIDSAAAIALAILGIFLLLLFGVILFQKLNYINRPVIPSAAVVLLILYVATLLILTITRH